MKLNWINKQNNSALILFFNGWGFDHNCINCLDVNDFDLIEIHDYSTLEEFTPEICEGYAKITVVAWSFGVWAADVVLSKIKGKITNAYAIGGTPLPVHDQFGIPVSIFTNTLERLSENNLKKFQIRVMGGSIAHSHNTNLLPLRSFQDQKKELIALAKHFHHYRTCGLNWDKAIIGRNDFIFPFENLKNFWKEKGVQLDLPHFIFDNFTSFEELLTQFEK